jgi:4-diphosphocytidyl-2-C-methyl-D-erythritol kinase
MSESIRVPCPAKVNLYLRVVGRRPDGYHEVVTVMQPLSLADELTAAPGGRGISLECDHPDLPRGEANLVWQAALKFGEATGQRLRVRFRLRKRIPLAAGLGGGSSDGAGLLGADVPFFLGRGPAVGRGIGTQLSPVSLPPYCYLLLNPGLPLSTRWVYENLDLGQLTAGPERDTWNSEQPEQWVVNDLATVACERFPELKDLLGRLQQLGARAQGLSGSGPTVFGLFPTLEAARDAGRRVRRSFSGWLAVAQGLTGQETDLTWENRVWMI